MQLRIIIVEIRAAILRLRDLPKRPPPLLWSRGWYGFSNWSGCSNYLYPAYPTRYRVKSLEQLVGKRGVIWLRIGSDPPKPEIDNGAPGDLAVFARDIVGRLGGPTILVTTDGDRSIPSGLPKESVKAILSDPNIIAWYTQNLDGITTHSKFRFLPIGIDLHTRIGGVFSGPKKKAKLFEYAIKTSSTPNDRLFRIWSDVHLEQDLGNMETEFKNERGKPGAQLFETRGELLHGIQSGQLKAVLDCPTNRLPLSDVWNKYGNYAFVMSLPGHGLDCHRTWEALALGAIIITVHSPIDELLRPYKVVFLDRIDSSWWRVLARRGWLQEAKRIGDRGKKLDLDWDGWIAPIRQEIC